MPNIRVMVWNIRKFGQASTQIPGMLTALSEIIRGANPDIVIILEVVEGTGAAGLAALCNQLQADDFPNNDWRGMLSYSTGAERYAFICRDLGLVRPLEATATTNDTGSAEHPVRNLDTLRFTTWPVNFPAQAPPPPLPLFNQFPLAGMFYEDPGDRPGKKQKTFSGQALRGSGYREGNGGRLPCLAVFHIHTPGRGTAGRCSPGRATVTTSIRRSACGGCRSGERLRAPPSNPSRRKAASSSPHRRWRSSSRGPPLAGCSICWRRSPAPR